MSETGWKQIYEQMTGWQPIETAPQDGTEFLLWVCTTYGYEYNGGVARWVYGKLMADSLANSPPWTTPVAWHPLPPPFRIMPKPEMVIRDIEP